MSNRCYLSGCEYYNPDDTCMYENPTCLLRDKLAKEQAYQQGRADAIEEFKDLLLKHKSKDEYPVMCFDEFTLNRFVEQLKEKQNEYFT